MSYQIARLISENNRRLNGLSAVAGRTTKEIDDGNMEPWIAECADALGKRPSVVARGLADLLAGYLQVEASATIMKAYNL